MLDPRTLDLCAEAGHESTRRFKATVGQPVDPIWVALDADARRDKLDAVHFLLERNASAEVLHGWWVHRQRLRGWNPSDDYDVDALLDPALKLWSELALGDQVRFRIFRNCVLAMAATCARGSWVGDADFQGVLLDSDAPPAPEAGLLAHVAAL